MEDGISALAGLLLALILGFVPVVKTWYAEFTQEQKQLVFLGFLLVGSGISFGLSCANVEIRFVPVVACSRDGVLDLVNNFIVAMVAGVSTYATTKYIGKSASSASLHLKGQGIVEYALILALVAVVVLAALTILGPLVRDVFSTINMALK